MDFINEIKRIACNEYDGDYFKDFQNLCDYIKEHFNINEDVFQEKQIDDLIIKHINKKWHIENHWSEDNDDLTSIQIEYLHIGKISTDTVELVGEDDIYYVYADYDVMSDYEFYYSLFFVKKDKKQRNIYKRFTC